MSGKIRIEEIAVVARISPIDFEMREYGLDCAASLVQKYMGDGKSRQEAEKIVAEKEARSRAQKEFIEEIQAHGFRPGQILRIDDWSLTEKLKNYQAVVSFGGDDTQPRVAHHIDSIPIIGLRADTGSLGKSLYYNRENFWSALEKIQAGEYLLEEWPRLQARVDGKSFASAISQYCLSAPFSNKHMSRFVIKQKCGEERVVSPCVPGSGVIVWTGVGSTGQARSAAWYLGGRISSFKPTKKKAMWAIKEPYSPGRHPFEEYGITALCGGFIPGEELILVSKCKTIDQLLRTLNIGPGHITSDSIEDMFFKEGAEIHISIADDPLRVIYVPEIAVKNEQWR